MKWMIRPSETSLKFYEFDGWTEDLLKSFLLKGGIFKIQTDRLPYYMLAVDAVVDEEFLLKSCYIVPSPFFVPQQKASQKYILWYYTKGAMLI